MIEQAFRLTLIYNSYQSLRMSGDFSFCSKHKVPVKNARIDVHVCT